MDLSLTSWVFLLTHYLSLECGRYEAIFSIMQVNEIVLKELFF